MVSSCEIPITQELSPHGVYGSEMIKKIDENETKQIKLRDKDSTRNRDY